MTQAERTERKAAALLAEREAAAERLRQQAEAEAEGQRLQQEQWLAGRLDAARRLVQSADLEAAVQARHHRGHHHVAATTAVSIEISIEIATDQLRAHPNYSKNPAGRLRCDLDNGRAGPAEAVRAVCPVNSSS